MITPRKAEADSAGYFYFQLLPPGEYTVTVTGKGFRTFKLTSIKVETGSLPTLDIGLDVGSISETVEVSARAEIVEFSPPPGMSNNGKPEPASS